MKKKLIGIFICVLLISTTIPVSSGLFEGPQEEIKLERRSLRSIIFNFFIKMLMRFGHFPSLSACIIEEDEVVWSKGYGLYDIENEKQATENTVYMVCSISKTITGTALMQLYEEGLFELDDDINDYLPFSIRNPHFPDDPITFRMLLSHSSSMNEDPISFYWLNFSGDPPFSWYPYPWLEEYLIPGGDYYVPEIWNDTYPPGNNSAYANVNFVIIMYLIELLSGESFIDYCDDNIFSPLEMYNTSFNLSDFDIGEVAIPYHYHNREYVTINNITDLEWYDNPPDIYYRMLHYPVGGLYTSVSELSHFLIAHMNNGVYKGTRILDEDTVEEMHTIQPPEQGFALAWYHVINRFGKRFSGHGGDIPGIHNSMFMDYPENDTGVIFFVNGGVYTPLGLFLSVPIHNLLFLKADTYGRNLMPSVIRQLFYSIKYNHNSNNLENIQPLIGTFENN